MKSYHLIIILIFTFIANTCQDDETLSDTQSYESEYEQYRRFMRLNSHCNQTLSTNRDEKPKFDKLVLLIIDALRIDFVPTVLDHEAVVQRMPYMEGLIKTQGIALQSIASIPTVTLPRIKALLSGTIPSFMDYIMNLNAYAFQSDNLVHQLAHAHKKRIHFYGDDTWGNLFPEESGVFTKSNLTSSFFVTDTVFVDKNVTWNVDRDLKQLNEWDVMILHYLGVDHIGHSQGYYSELMPKKLREMDEVFRRIYDTLRDNNESALIIITGDHGMTNEGNHGGNTRDETHTPLILISTNPTHKLQTHKFNHQPVTTRTYLQIDFAPTISSLFDLSIPTHSQGRLISPILERFQLDTRRHLCYAFQNSLQIQHVIKNSKNDKEAFRNNVQKLKNIFDKAMLNHEKYLESPSETIFRESIKFYQKYLDQVQLDYVQSLEKPRSYLILSLLILFLLFGVIFTLLWTEFKNPESILFDIFILKYFGRPYNLNGFYGSIAGRLIMLGLIISNLFGMSSINFMQMEHYFWNTLVVVVLGIGFMVAIGFYLQTYSLKPLIQTSVALTLFLTLILNWKIIILSNQWGDSAGHSNDIYSWLSDKNSKSIASSLFVLSQIVITFGVLGSTRMGLFPLGIFLSGQVFVYLYRSQTGVLSTPIPSSIFSFENPNTCAQLVFYHALVLLFYFLSDKIKNLITSSTLIKYSQVQTSFLQILLQIWTLLSALLLDPFMLPLLALNVLLESLVDKILSKDRISYQFFRLGTYLICGYSAFYQIGNTNSLSTVNVNSCFIGLNSYQLLPCTGLMITSIYSTYIFWILSFFVRFENQMIRSDTIVYSYQNSKRAMHDHFNSIITCQQLIRLAVMATNLSVTLALRDHPYIWSVLSPKLMYELMFTALNLVVSILMVILFVPKFL